MKKSIYFGLLLIFTLLLSGCGIKENLISTDDKSYIAYSKNVKDNIVVKDFGINFQEIEGNDDVYNLELHTDKKIKAKKGDIIFLSRDDFYNSAESSELLQETSDIPIIIDEILKNDRTGADLIFRLPSLDEVYDEIVIDTSINKENIIYSPADGAIIKEASIVKTASVNDVGGEMPFGIIEIQKEINGANLIATGGIESINCTFTDYNNVIDDFGIEVIGDFDIFIEGNQNFIDETIELATCSASIGTSPFSIGITINAIISVDGKIRIGFDVRPVVGLNYTENEGLDCTNRLETNLRSCECAVEAMAGLELTSGIYFLRSANEFLHNLYRNIQNERNDDTISSIFIVKPLYDFGCKLGIRINVSSTTRSNGLICNDVLGHEFLEASFGQDNIINDIINEEENNLVIKNSRVTLSNCGAVFGLIDENNAHFKIEKHMEKKPNKNDFEEVAECTWGKRTSYFEDNKILVKKECPNVLESKAVICNPDMPENIQKPSRVKWSLESCSEKKSNKNGYKKIELVCKAEVILEENPNDVTQTFTYCIWDSLIMDYYSGVVFSSANLINSSTFDAPTRLTNEDGEFDVYYGKSIDWDFMEIISDNITNVKQVLAVCTQKIVIEVPEWYDGLVYALVPRDRYTNSNYNVVNNSVKYALDQDVYVEGTQYFRFGY